MIETTGDRRSLLGDAPDLALFATVPDAVDEFGEASVIVSRNVAGVFDRAYRESNGREGFRPCFLCLDEDAQFIQQYQRIMLAGQVWQITNRQPDGTGFTQMILRLLGVYRIDDTGDWDAGFPYILPIVLGNGQSLDNDGNPVIDYGFPYPFPMILGNGMTVAPDPIPGGAPDPNNPRLQYPYTISTYLDYSTTAASL